MSPENLLGEWARLLLASLGDAGLRHVVISPGSRSTPLCWAALKCKALETKCIIDERDAGFYAVSHAKITGKAVALICTSGSAVANYFPAVVEAALSRTPLLVVSADRPFELQDCGASQTIDQTRLFGAYARFVELGMPDAGGASLSALRRRAAQSLLETEHPVPGVVHLNFRARKPLEPVAGKTREALDLTARVDALLAAPLVKAGRPRAVPGDDDLRSLARDLSRSERGLIVCGPRASGSAREPVRRLSEAAGLPVYAEATSQLRFDAPDLAPELRADGLDALCRASLGEDLVPDLVLRIGDPPVSSALERLLASRPSTAVHVIADHGFPDPTSQARTLLLGDVADTVSRLSGFVRKEGVKVVGGAFAKRLAAASQAACRAATAFTEQAGFGSEAAATRVVISTLASGSLLALGNSLPVRHADAFVPSLTGKGISVWSQRGASGIDGVVAGAAGAAEASAKPTALIVGDVSLLHDLGGFAVAASVRVPFVVVVLNNDGGRIFEQLPLRGSGLSPDELAFWTTPHGRSFGSVAKLWDLAYEAPGSTSELRSAIETGLSKPSVTLVEVRCDPHGAERDYAELAERVRAELGRSGPSGA